MLFFEYIAGLLERVPATLWGVVFGSFLSLTGVVISNRASERRQVSQLEHDRATRKQERELSLRKDIYLAAVEAIQTGMVLLSKLSNLEISVEEHIKPYLERLPALVKVQVIGLTDTIRAVTDVAGTLSVSVLQLTGKRIPLDISRQQQNFLDNQASEFENERNRWLEEMRQFNLALKTDERLWANLKGNFEFEENRAANARDRIKNDKLALLSKQIEFAEDCMIQSRSLLNLLAPAIIAIRNELGVPTDTQAYQKLLEVAASKQQAAFDEFLKVARQSLK